MIRKIIHIDEDRCDGCGLCASACHEGAIGMVDGRARLLRDDYCDGLGNCLPACPRGAITFIEREAAEYDEAAVQKHLAGVKEKTSHQENRDCHQGGCPGSKAQLFVRQAPAAAMEMEEAVSQLRQWPVQIKLVAVNAPCFENTNLLVSADCAAYAHGNFHKTFMRNRVTLIGCPKLDEVDYGEKLTEIIKRNNIRSVTVVRMEVPCCAGIENAVKTALQNSGKMIPWRVVTLSREGEILED
ncbi:MAG: 4Fe-4S binding protein [Synergistaceae bacterium]|jgi:NAD-dependent dihydropyrimidine dehydrogenase PreA subunit|nr:4Fe-4S binding protein [Synergistaceae bacterium]